LLAALWVGVGPGAACCLAAGKEMCTTKYGLEVCVRLLGPCDLSHVLPKERAELRLELLQVAIVNGSNRRFRITPEDFIGITELGQAVALDAPLYERIELKTKLPRAGLEPNQSMQGHLFFPSTFGRIRTLVYNAYPYFYVTLY
jgi:hypothetical protein